MNTIVNDPPIAPIDLTGSEGGEKCDHYIVVAENLPLKFFCVFYLDADDEVDCRKLVLHWFLETDHGIPTKCTIVKVSDGIETFNMSSNDDEVLDYLGLKEA